jgi:hypothetical protein
MIKEMHKESKRERGRTKREQARGDSTLVRVLRGKKQTNKKVHNFKRMNLNQVQKKRKKDTIIMKEREEKRGR